MKTETDLATRLEQAGPESQRVLLCEAFKAIFPEPSSGTWDAQDAWDEHYDRFTAMLDCGAYLSAAEMLVPQPGGHWSYNSLSGRTTVTFFPANGDEDTIETRGRATTPSLALAAACVRAAIAGKES